MDTARPGTPAPRGDSRRQAQINRRTDPDGPDSLGVPQQSGEPASPAAWTPAHALGDLLLTISYPLNPRHHAHNTRHLTHKSPAGTRPRGFLTPPTSASALTHSSAPSAPGNKLQPSSDIADQARVCRPVRPRS